MCDSYSANYEIYDAQKHPHCAARI